MPMYKSKEVFNGKAYSRFFHVFVPKEINYQSARIVQKCEPCCFLLLKKMIKQRSESIEVYKKNNRSDLLEIEQGEVAVLSEYLPKQLSEEETINICKEIIEKTGASSVKDMGKVMGQLKQGYSDTIDFSKAGALIKELLNK